MKIEPIIEDNYYHIYNRGINGTNIFNEAENYLHFLRLYEKYIEPVTETYAWCLMPNHFHLLVKIKALNEIYNLTNPSGLKDPTSLITPIGLEASQTNLSGFQNPTGLNIISNQFSKFFNAYAKAFNKRYNRTGSLLERPFDRKRVQDIKYFKNLIYYIHNNPVHHGFCKHLQDYAWSSYGSVISIKPTKIEREKIIGYFDSIGNFIDFHNQKHSFGELSDFLFD